MSESPRPEDRDPHYSDDDAKNILRRAVEIEKEGHVTASRLREIAEEAQISPDAMNRALAEAAAEKRVGAAADGVMQSGAPAGSQLAQTRATAFTWALVAAIIVAAGMIIIAL